MSKKPYYEVDGFKLIHGDTFKELKKIEPKSIDMIFADPPYFLSGDGISCSAGKMVSVKKGEWDEKIDINEKHKFNRKWIKLCYSILKDDGTIWISGTMHNIYSIGMALEQEGFKIINNITWRKLNPPPNISCRAFVHSTETILWAKKDLKKAKHKFNYSVMKELNDNKQMKDVWDSSLTKPSEKKYGKHPTQKPIAILEKIILASTDENDLILDPFNVELFKQEIIDLSKKGSMIIFSSHRMEHVELFCKKLAIIMNGKPVIEGYLKDIKEKYRKKNIFIKGDLKREDLTKIPGVIAVTEKSDEFEVKIKDSSIVNDVFNVVKNKENVTKFVVEEPSLNEIFVSKVGKEYDK